MTSEDQHGFVNLDDQDFDFAGIRKAIKPQLWRVLICPVQPRSMSKGGIALPEAVKDGEEHLNYLGRVVSLGPLAGKSPKFENPDWQVWADGGRKGKTPPRYLWDVKEGDCVVYGRYSGQRKEWKGVKLLTLNDDEILDVVASLEGFRVYAA